MLRPRTVPTRFNGRITNRHIAATESYTIQETEIEINATKFI